MIDIFYFDRKLKKIDVKDISKIKSKIAWIDITDAKKSDISAIKKIINLHPVTQEDILLSNGRVKIESFPDYLFSSFYTVYMEDNKKLEVIPVEYLLSNNLLISAHKKKIAPFEKLKKEGFKIDQLLKIGPEAVFHKLLDEQINDFFPVLEILDDELENIDEKIAIHSKRDLMKKILILKRRIVEIKKIAIPQREKVGLLARRRYRFIPEISNPYFRDTYDEAIRISDIVENFRENIGNTFDAYMTSVAHTQNEIMKVLSIIATVALPLTVISGIYGTNFMNLPGSKAYQGFWIMVLIMASFILFMVYFFKKRRWF